MPVGSPVLSMLRMIPLLTSLQEFRAATAVCKGIPVFCVFGDTVLNAIANQRPVDRGALLKIRGMSEEKCREFGADVLRIVAAYWQVSRQSAARTPSPEQDRAGRFVEGARSGTRRKLQRSHEIPDQEAVYILELLHGGVYVGRTKNLRRRLNEHMSGQGSAFTRAFPPTGLMLPRLGKVSGSGEAAERDETLRYMYLRGIPLVRGWKYTRVELSDADRDDAEGNIRELFDLCRKCGHPGHFMGACRQSYDRNGRLISKHEGKPRQG